ncbi:uncharacterized protein LOC112258669 isoform X2 [Oncorhynchus tshawytscha]|uniref:uncharacterized protein LOC112258669 isoform X2 n=1 Tax=Oncorhynchus tshawytscha TaxID=74940 RepID=UPI000D0A3A91|nr:uncharacterized protein LOC112258669 isoform X2 [Oncorhynchus tshawytscha]
MVGAMSQPTYTEMESFTHISQGMSHTSILLIVAERRITLKVNEVIVQHSPRDKVAIVDLQHAFHCCGAENCTDWLLQSSHGNISFVPHSCCHVDYVACVKVVTTDNIYQRGFVQVIKESLKRNLVWLGAACIVLGLIEGSDGSDYAAEGEINYRENLQSSSPSPLSTHSFTHLHIQARNHMHRSTCPAASPTTLLLVVHFHSWLCQDNAPVCSPPSPLVGRVSARGMRARVVNSSERAVKKATIKTGIDARQKGAEEMSHHLEPEGFQSLQNHRGEEL